MSRYKSVQAGPNTQLGGEKTGLFKVAYQVGMAAMVKGVPSIPASSHKAMEAISLGKSFILLTVKQTSNQGNTRSLLL